MHSTECLVNCPGLDVEQSEQKMKLLVYPRDETPEIVCMDTNQKGQLWEHAGGKNHIPVSSKWQSNHHLDDADESHLSPEKITWKNLV